MATDNKTEAPGAIMSQKPVRLVAGRTLEQWRELARRDDCLDRMVPSDLRALVAAIPPAH